MQFFILTNQVKAVEWGLNSQQASLFSFLYLLRTWAQRRVINGETYYSISKNKIITEMPLLTDKPDTILRMQLSLREKGLIKMLVIKQQTYIAITERGLEWGIKVSAESNQAYKRLLEHIGCDTGTEDSHDQASESLEKNPIMDLGLGEKSCDISESNPMGIGKNSELSMNHVSMNQISKNHNKKNIQKKVPQVLDFSSWPSEPSEQVWADYVQMRKAKRAPITQTVLNALGKELAKAKGLGFTVDECLAQACLKNWQGFNAHWMLNAQNGYPAPKAQAAQHSHQRHDKPKSQAEQLDELTNAVMQNRVAAANAELDVMAMAAEKEINPVPHLNLISNPAENARPAIELKNCDFRTIEHDPLHCPY